MREERKPCPQRVFTWEIRRLKATPAAFIGLVHAPDETSAVKAAIKQFAIRSQDQKSLIMSGRWSDAETIDPLYADERNFYKVELWTADDQHIIDLIYAGNNLERARKIFAELIGKRPQAHLTIRQRIRVLDKWPKTAG